MYYVGLMESKYLLVKIYYLSKLVEFDVCVHVDRKHTIRGLKQWEESKALFSILITDRARHFFHGEVRRWAIQRGVDHIKTLVYEHKSNETIERCVQNVF